jgi:predicted metal-dependent hydrolase
MLLLNKHGLTKRTSRHTMAMKTTVISSKWAKLISTMCSRDGTTSKLAPRRRLSRCCSVSAGRRLRRVGVG